jgi:signal transduction histidine kinase
MALHVDNAMLFRQAQQAQQRATLLAEITALLAASLDSADILQQLARSTVQHFADMCVVYRLNAEGRFYRAALAHSDRAQESLLDRLNEFPIPAELQERLRNITTSGEPEFTAVVTEKQTQETPSGQYQETIRNLHPQSSILAPLTARGNGIGVIALTVTRDGSRYSTEDLKFVQDLAQRAAIAIDNERLYRELHQANRLKDDFLATLSHELRTPLTAIAGWAAVLKRTTIDRKTFDQAVETIHRNVALQASLVDDLLDVSRIISGKMRLEVETVDLGAHISSWVETTRSAANAKSIQLELTVEDNVGSLICDPARIQQVVWNLLSNAIKFTPKGGKVQVVARTNEFRGSEIIVTDTGIGIVPEFLPFVFDRFRQFDGSNTRRTAGLGLGLSIVRHLVELHGGTVSAESCGPNRGARFRVVLPQMESTNLHKERAVPL